MANLQRWKSDVRKLWSRLTGIGPTATLEQSEEARRRFDEEYEALLAEMTVPPLPRRAPAPAPRPWPPIQSAREPAHDRRRAERRAMPARRAASGG